MSPNSIADGVTGDLQRGQMFANKAKELFNSVSCDKGSMDYLLVRVNSDMNAKCSQTGVCYNDHKVSLGAIVDSDLYEEGQTKWQCS